MFWSNWKAGRWLVLVILLYGASRSKALAADAADALFDQGEIPRLRIEIVEPDLSKLRGDNRNYVRCKIVENDQREYKDVGIKLKGAAGSFRGLDDRPALTLNMDKYIKKQNFHDLDKFHLNNSVQDGTYFNELICGEIAAAAKVPAARATHARVWLNGRDLGLYVLKEGFDSHFLKRHFGSNKGNLYDGGFCAEIDSNLEKDSGDGPDDRSDLKELVAACREPDAAKRWERVGALVDIDQFCSFVAFELMTCHWDGYCLNRNNYRIYFHPGTKRWQFMPHGMDQMFGDTNASVLNVPGALVCQAVLTNPEWRAKYRDRLTAMLPIFSSPEKLYAKIDAVQARLKPVLTAMNENLARDNENHARGLKERLAARAKALEQQLSVPEPRPLSFDGAGVAQLKGWYIKAESADARFEPAMPTADAKQLVIACGPSNQCVASWRTKVLLTAGTYEFRGRAKAEGLVAQQGGSGTGAGLRISGGQRTNQIQGDADWQELVHEITIGSPMQEVELVAELRATKGLVRFETGTLRMVRKAK